MPSTSSTRSIGDRGASVRAGLLVGPHDPTDRFTYWPRRLAEGGDVLAPGTPDAPVQIVDARDLGEWLLELAEHGPGGVFNATGPAAPLTLGELLERAIAAVGSDARLVWTDEQRILDAGSSPGWSCRSGCPATTTPASSAPRSNARSPPACASGPSRTPSATRSPGAAKRASSVRRMTREKERAILAGA